MYISSIQIENYKSFASSETVPLSPGFNVIVGTNNSGKTAFIQVLSLGFETKSHNRLASKISSVQVEFDFTVEEFKELIKVHYLKGKSKGTFFAPIEAGTKPENLISKFLKLVNSGIDNREHLRILSKYIPDKFVSTYLIGFDDIRVIKVAQQVTQFEIEANNYIKFISEGNHANTANLFPELFATIFKDRIYTFDAERMRVSSSPTGDSDILKKDASNLAEVLNKLQGNAKRFDDFNKLVNRIFPQVARVSVLPYQGHLYQIYVWDEIAYLEGNEVWAVPLLDSGTGIGQVLAILYIVFTARLPKTIIIDEPQSFLHPGAIRILFEILGSPEFSKHQYIVSTHSPLVITACDPQNIIQVRKVGAESHIEVFDKSDRLKLTEFLSEVGAKLSDVFGADDILWVEGPTEELCFPLILTQLSKQPLLGTAIIGVKSTGDFALSYKYVDKIIAMHSKLSETPNLLPQALGFLFDTEILSEKNVEDYKKLGVFVIPRRLYENYLINPKAIAAILSHETGLTVISDEIKVWLKENQWKKEFFKPASVPNNQTDEIWHKKVHGAKILREIFRKFSSEKHEYDKVKHGPQLTRWILENDPESLVEIKNCIQDVITQGKQKFSSSRL